MTDAPQAAAASARAPSWRSSFAGFVSRYGSADPRSLGLLRIALGALLAYDVLLKLPDVEAHFSNVGWLPNHFALFRPMSSHLFSVYFAFSSPLEVELFMGLHVLVCLLLLVGYRTKLMQILALVLTTSLNSRNILIENGGMVVLNLLLVWTAFLPLGARFSLDALSASLRARRETSASALNERADEARQTSPVVSIAVTALLLQWATIYAFNAVQKNGAPWRDGTAVYYFLQQDRLVTWLGAWLRGSLPLGVTKLLSFSALSIEALIPLLLLSPWRTRQARLLAFAAAIVLHVSIDAVLDLGSFSWAMLVAFFAFVPPEAWVWAKRRWARRRQACVVHFDPESGAALWICRVVKRCDGLGLVTFRALDDASPETDAGLWVDAEGAEPAAGWAAVLTIADALWCGRRPLLLLAPLLRRRVTRRLAQLTSSPEELDHDFGLELLPSEGDARALPESPARLLWQRSLSGLGEACVVFLLIVCGHQVLYENAAVPSALKPRGQPTLFEAVITYPRLFQGWSMFAPVPPQSDGRLVIDGRTKDGRALDPLTGLAPVFEVHPSGTPRSDLIWGYFHTRIAEDRFRVYWNGVREYLMNHHKLSGRPQDELASFVAYYVTETFPAPGAKKQPAQRQMLFSSTSVPSDTPPPPVHHRSPPTRPRAK